MLRRSEEVPIETNFVGFANELSNMLLASKATLLATQARCRAAMSLPAPLQVAAIEREEAYPIELAGGAPYAGVSSYCPQSPMQHPSRKRPHAIDRQDSIDLDEVIFEDGTVMAAPSACPQSPVSFPSRRLPFGIRNPSLDSLAPAAAPAMIGAFDFGRACPQSPVSLPSRRRPFGVRDLSSDSLAPADAPATSAYESLVSLLSGQD